MQLQALHKQNISVMADIVLNHKNGADESEKAPVIQVDSNDRNKVISEPSKKRSTQNIIFPGRNKKYSEFVWDWHTFTGVDECTDD